MASAPAAVERRDALAERLFLNAIGAFDLFSVYLGDRLGLYRALADHGAMTSAELAEAAESTSATHASGSSTRPRASCWTSRGTPTSGGSASPRGTTRSCSTRRALNYGAPLARAVLASIRPVDALVEAFRNGGGVPYAAYGDDLHESQAAFTRPLFENQLGKEWLPAVPEIHDRLSSSEPARVADVACGQGRSSIEIARAYPNAQVDGIDSDRASIEAARKNVEGSGVEARVTFHERNAADAGLAGRYDLVTIFEALHDMSYPVEVLKAARGLLGDGGLVFIGDERTAEEFTAPASEAERLFYGFSVFHCLPVGMVGEGAAGTGTVIRPQTVKDYARQAGFASCEVLPIEHDFWRFYLLRP
jgi:2-polyprenyl-3-methyl-5-hydroxy-6-metoxy-1,4-benzoquinol methylase